MVASLLTFMSVHGELNKLRLIFSSIIRHIIHHAFPEYKTLFSFFHKQACFNLFVFWQFAQILWDLALVSPVYSW